MEDDAGRRTDSDGAALVRRFRAGDESAFRELFERFGPVLTARIEQRLPRRLRRKIAVSDVVQESLLSAFDARESLREDSENALRAWLRTIADHKVHEAVRRLELAAKRDSRREVTRNHRAATAEVPGGQASPSQIAIGAEMHALAQHAMRRLPPDYREVLRLARQEHLSLVDAAERMGRSHEATKKLYGRALARFRIEFGRLGGDRP
jgi:RNA polymerase sigma-70 factor (ECF subfamily)